jgi:hypothetical protein
MVVTSFRAHRSHPGAQIVPFEPIEQLTRKYAQRRFGQGNRHDVGERQDSAERCGDLQSACAGEPQRDDPERDVADERYELRAKPALDAGRTQLPRQPHAGQQQHRINDVRKGFDPALLQPLRRSQLPCHPQDEQDNGERHHCDMQLLDGGIWNRHGMSIWLLGEKS